MAPSILQYDDIEDIRYNSFTGEFTPIVITDERHTIPNTGPYIIKLFEAPQQNAPSTTTVRIGGTVLKEVGSSVTPGINQYRVTYYDNLGMGQIEFNSTRHGQEASVDYYGLGHLIQKISLDTRVPSTGNTTIAGNKTFTGNCIANGNWTITGNWQINNYLIINDETIFHGNLTIQTQVADYGDYVAIGGSPVAFGFYGGDPDSKVYILGIEGSVNIPLISAMLTNDTNTQISCLVLRHITSGSPGNNFGTQILFEIADDDAPSGTLNNAASISTYRNGADTASDLYFKVNNALNTGMVIQTDLVVNCTYGGVATKRVTGNSSPPINAELEIDFPSVPVGFLGISDNYFVWKTAAATWRQSVGTACL